MVSYALSYDNSCTDKWLSVSITLADMNSVTDSSDLRPLYVLTARDRTRDR
jgi:hypothetical protein